MNQNENRSSLLAKNIAASFVVKGWSAVIVLLMVPLTLKMLGIYSNGVWLTISGILMWIDFMDIGLGNGLRNAVTNYIATGETEKVREAVSSTIMMLTLIVIPLIILLCGIILVFDMYATLGVDRQEVQQLDIILMMAVSLTCGTFILKSIGNFYMGLQLPAVNNLILCLGQTLSLLLTFVAYLLGSRSLLVVVLINTLSPLFVWLLSIPYTFFIKYPQYKPGFKYVNMKMSKSLCSTGVQFFILQICGVILLTSTNIIISKMFSPAEVTPYQIAYRYFSIMLVLFNIICMPFWNATTDAYTRGDMDWIHETARKLNLFLIFIFFGLMLMVLLSDFIYSIWVGSDVHIPFSLSVSMATYIFILIASFRYSYILNGINILRIQLYFTITAAIIFLPLAWVSCSIFGTVTSLVWTMCAVQMPGLIANMWKHQQIINKQ